MFPCSICDVELNSAEQKKAHCRGKNHIKRMAARDKALELGTDFDSTPNHCDVCDVPLTSKMTAIDHFKGKMHQKKLKAVEDRRQGFRNYCDVCDVRLQSLKVSEAHFNGKLHRKQERKRAKEQNSTIERRFRDCRIAKRCDMPQTNVSCVAVNSQRCNISSTWESLNCDNDRDSKDLLSEFRSSLSGKSNSNSPDTPRTSSPTDTKETYFSFDNMAISQYSSLGKKVDLSCSIRRENVCRKHGVCKSSFHTTAPSRRDVASVDTKPPNRPSSTASKHVFEIKPGPWEFQAKNSLPSYLSESCGNVSKEPPNMLEQNAEIKNGVVSRNQEFQRTQAIIHILRQTVYPISSSDIALKIGCISPSEVNSVLVNLEKHKIVVKSGYNPIRWFLVGGPRVLKQPKSYPVNTTANQLENCRVNSAKEPYFLQKANDPYLIESNNVASTFSTTSQAFLPGAILSSACSFTTTTAPSDAHRPVALRQVFESNLVNLFQQSGPLTIPEIQKKPGFGEEDKLRFVLNNLLEQRVIVKEGDAPTRWRLASVARPNSVGVIGEERKRRSPVQNGVQVNGILRERTPSPPQQDGLTEQIYDSFHGVGKPKARESLQKKENGNGNSAKPNGVWQHLNGPTNDPDVNMVAQRSNPEVSRCLYHNPPASSYGNKVQSGKRSSRTSPSPSAPFLKETTEFLDNLTDTKPSGYQKELYQQAMQEDIVCYVPTGTGQDVVLAQVVHHMLLMNPTKQALVVAEDTITALDQAQLLRKELKQNRKINVALVSGQLKQSNGKGQVVVVTSSSCLCLLNCGALSWKDVCLLVFDDAGLCFSDDSAHQILRDYYIKAKTESSDCHVPKLLSFLGSSSGEDNVPKTVAKFNKLLGNMGDIFLATTTEFKEELEKDKSEAMFVCVSAGLTKEEERMFAALHTYLALVFENLAAQCQPLNSYRELFKLCFQSYPIDGEAFAKLVRLTGQPLEKRLPSSCLKTWRHYLAICEVIFALIECGEDFAKDLLANLQHEAFGFSWASDAGLPADELYVQVLPAGVSKKLPWGFNGSRVVHGSGIQELLDQLSLIQWENARVSSERPLALVVVKLNKTAKTLANYLAHCPRLAKRNVKATFLDGSRPCQQKAVVSAIKRKQYQVIVSTDDLEDNLDLPECELVVLLDQPTTSSALAQLRKRQGTNVVALCRDCDGEEKLKELLKKEEHVEKAISIIRGVDST